MSHVWVSPSGMLLVDRKFSKAELTFCYSTGDVEENMSLDKSNRDKKGSGDEGSCRRESDLLL